MNQKNIASMIRFWGVRGSIATPGTGTSKTGGNTSCVECTFGDQSIVFDAGTGLRGLGDHWMKQGIPESCSILLSHTHWDHIQGLPFFTPLYMPSSKIGLYGQASASLSLGESSQRHTTASHFPGPFEDLPSALHAQEGRVCESSSVGNLVVGTDVNWRTDTQYSINQTPDTIQPGYAIWNANIGIATDDGLRVMLLARNLTDKSYSTFLTRFGQGVARFVPRDDRRYFGISINKDF